METGEIQQKQHPKKEIIARLRQKIILRIPEAEKILSKSGTPKQEQTKIQQINISGGLVREELRGDIDSLTGLYNRRFLIGQIERTIAEAERFNIPFSVVMIDLDNFKKINDNFGHAAGDEVLKQAAQIYKSTFRETDTIARLGGDEFVIILMGSKNGAAIKAADKARTNIENTLTEAMRKKQIRIVTPITQTAGVATYEKGLTVSELLSRADEALYNGKRPNDGSTPRNRVVSYTGGMTMPTEQKRELLKNQ